MPSVTELLLSIMITFGPVQHDAVLHLAYLCQALTAIVLLVSFFLSKTAPEMQMEFADQTCNALLFALTVLSTISSQADLLLPAVDAAFASTSLRAVAVCLLQSSASLTQLKASRKARS